MPDNILDYIEAIQEYESEGVCFVSSDTIWIEGSTNEFKSSNDDFLCFEKGDYFIVWGTDYNDGIYEKANDVDPYVLKAKHPSYLNPGTVNLTSEDCTGRIVAINEVDAIGKGSVVSPAFRHPAERDASLALLGGIGSSSLQLPALSSYAATGIIGGAHVPALTTEATGDQGPTGQGSVTIASLKAEGYSGTVGDSNFPALTSSVSIDETIGSGDSSLPPLWCTATEGPYTRVTFWGRGNPHLPALVGVKYTDAESSFPTIQSQAASEGENKGSAYLAPLSAKGYSVGTVGRARIPSLTANVTGASGAQGVATLPALTCTVYRGAWSRTQIPRLQAYAKSGFPDVHHCDGSADLPAFEASGKYTEPPESQTGEGSASLSALEFEGTGKHHVRGDGAVSLSRLKTSATGVLGVTGGNSAVLSALEMGGAATTDVIGSSEVTIAALEATARVMIEGNKYPILSHQDYESDWTWEIV